MNTTSYSDRAARFLIISVSSTLLGVSLADNSSLGARQAPAGISKSAPQNTHPQVAGEKPASNDGFASPEEIASLVQTLELNLCEPQRDEYRQSLWALQAFDGGRSAVPMLMKSLKTGGSATLLSVVVLIQIGPFAEEAVPELIDLLKTKRKDPFSPKDDLIDPESIYDILRAIGPRARPAVPLITRSTNKSRDDTESFAAALAILKITGYSPSLEPTLLSFLKSKDAGIREYAVADLFGPSGVRTPPLALKQALSALLNDPAPLVRFRAAQALWNIDHDSKRSVSVVKEVLEHPLDPLEVVQVLGFLSEMGPHARAAVPIIRRIATSDKSVLNHDEALVTLLKIQGPSAELLWQVKDALKKTPLILLQPFVASILLESNGPLKQDAIEGFAWLTSVRNERIDDWIVFDRIGELGERAAPLVPLCTEILHEKQPYRVQMAARALGRVGPPARPALPALRELARSRNVHVRLQAIDSIRKIDRINRP